MDDLLVVPYYVLSIANLSSHAASAESIRPGVEYALKNARKDPSKEPSKETLDLGVMIAKDQGALDRIGTYNVVKDFFPLAAPELVSHGVNRELEPDELVGIIKSRSHLYTELTMETCNGLYELWVKVGSKKDRSAALEWIRHGSGLKLGRKGDLEVENKMMTIYRQMVEEADKLKAAPTAQAQSSSTPVST